MCVCVCNCKMYESDRNRPSTWNSAVVRIRLLVSHMLCTCIGVNIHVCVLTTTVSYVPN